MKNDRPLRVDGAAFKRLYCSYTVTAYKIAVYSMGYNTCFEISGAAYRPRIISGNVQVLREYEFDALHGNVAAARGVMRRNCYSFHAALMFVSVIIHLGQNNSESHAPVRTDVLYGHIELHDSSERFEIGVAKIYYERILTSAYGEVDRNGTRLGIYITAAVHHDRRRGEGHGIVFGIRISDGLIDQFCAGSLSGVPYIEFQICALVARNSQ